MGKKNKYKQDDKENQGQKPAAPASAQQTPTGTVRQTEGAAAPPPVGTAAQQATKAGTSGAQRPNPAGASSSGQEWRASGRQGQGQPQQFVQRQQQQTVQQTQSRGEPPQQSAPSAQQQWGPPKQGTQRHQGQASGGQGQRQPQQFVQAGTSGTQRPNPASASASGQGWGTSSSQGQRQPQQKQQQQTQSRGQPQQSAPSAQQQWGPPKQGTQGHQGQAHGQRRPTPEQQQQRQPQGNVQQRQPQPTGQRPPQKSGRPLEAEEQADMQRQFQNLQCDDTASVTSIASSSSDTSSIKRGTAGQPGTVEANYLRLDLAKMPDTAFHYDVTITPDRPKKFLRPAFDLFNRQFFPNIPMAYDGIKSFYTAQRIQNIDNGFEQSVVLADSGGRTITFKIAIKATGSLQIDLRSLHNYRTERVYDKPMRALQCLEVVLASSCHNLGIRGGRSFYNKPVPQIPLGNGYELYTGLYQAMTLGDTPLFNVDISHKSFPKEMPVLNFFQHRDFSRDFSPQQPLAPRARYALIDYLKGVKIVYIPPKCFGASDKEYIVRDVSEGPAVKTMFTLDDGTKQSVAQYFHGRGYDLRYPNLNCLTVGSTVKTISIPIEFCFVKGGQALKKKDDSDVVKDMIRYAATSTNVRKEKIMALLRTFDHNNSPIVQSFGIRVGNAFIPVPMRWLTPPNIEYFNRQIVRVNNGSWRMDDNTQYLATKSSNKGDGQHKWAVLYSKDSRSMNFTILQKGLVENLLRAARGHNLHLNPKPLIDSFAQIDSKLTELKKENYDLVIVVIPFRRPTYADIKQAAELKVGILTQCIKENTVERRCDMMLANNLLLKINAKLNGTNHKINANTHIPLTNVMFIGADVTHPSPDQREIPSVVGVAASHDPHGACYNMQYRLQKSTLENIEDMESIFTRHMHVYKTYNNKFPDHIIYYRDGVSDGQFKIVRQNELRAMRVACQKLGVKAKITCTIVVKRHHTRFFPTQPTRDKKFNNVDPGTVVDRVIVHPNEVQFFMVSHQSIQGTAKPTRYNVIEDDAKMDIDDLQRLTHNLCHLFPRCNRAVSYPTPVYLAHLVAFRGRVYLEGTNRFGDLRREYEKRQINQNFMVSNPMYFV